MSWAEWKALPWWEQRALREGLVKETNPEAADAPVEQHPATPEEEAVLLAQAGFTL